jgi:hypothetical protein
MDHTDVVSGAHGYGVHDSVEQLARDDGGRLEIAFIYLEVNGHPEVDP